MKVYKSKIDWWLLIPFLILVCFGFSLVLNYDKMGWVIIVSTIAFVVFMYISTSYVVVDSKLIVKSMFIVHEAIEISSIKKIYQTKNPLSSPALSIDRIALVYNKYDEILISPRKKAEFINELRKLNPNIEVMI
jgi:hypothetical protein